MKPEEDVPGEVEVRASPIEGLGVFALRPFRAGERIRRVNLVREITPEAPLREEAGERFEHCAYPDGKVVLWGFPDRHVNHCCDPNAYERQEGSESYIVARRDIAAGEEISFDYNLNTSGGQSWPCRCGATRCRGESVGEFFALPVPEQREYRPLLADWFVRAHRGRLEALDPPSPAEPLRRRIERAFTRARYPGDGNLVRSAGCEPAEVEALFRGRSDWRELPADFLDRAGAASPSALSFFSAAAFRFYLPAYLIADLEGRLLYTDPLFYLHHGLDAATREGRVNVPGEGMRTWWDVQQVHFADFTREEATAIVEYLRWKLEFAELTESERRSVAEALESYWLPRAGVRATPATAIR